MLEMSMQVYIVDLLIITPKLDIAQMFFSSGMGKQGTVPPYIEYYSAMKRKELQKTWNSKGEFQVMCNKGSKATSCRLPLYLTWKRKATGRKPLSFVTRS